MPPEHDDDCNDNEVAIDPVTGIDEAGVMVDAQIVLTSGFDEEGAPQIWIRSTAGSMVQALGMLEVAKAHIIAEAYSE